MNFIAEFFDIFQIIYTHIKTIENRDKSLFGHHNFVLFGSCAFMIILGESKSAWFRQKTDVSFVKLHGLLYFYPTLHDTMYWI